MKMQTLLNSFEKNDWHWFGKFVSSPIFNKNEAVLKIFTFFKQYKGKAENSIKSENLFETVFPGMAYEPAKLHHVANYFLKTTEDYLSWNEWKKHDSERLLYLLKACRQRGLEPHFHAVHKRLTDQREQQPERNPQHYRFNYLMAMEDYQLSMQAGRSGAEQLQPLSDWHDVAFVAEKLKNACILMSRRKVLKMEFDTGLLPAVLDFVQKRPDLLKYPAISVYYYGYLTIVEPETEAHFFALKKQLKSAGQQFPVQELRDVYLLAVNFCINRINLRQDNYLRELLDLYQDGLAAAVFLENGHISRFTYTNIALLALRMKEYNWVYHFLETWRNKLPEHQRQGTWSFNLARYYCEIGDYHLAMPLLQTMDFDDILHNLMAKTMLIRMYYETGEHSALMSLLDSFEAYLRRKGQIGDQQKTAYRNTVRFVRKLVKLPPGNRKARQTLHEEVSATALLAEKDWLMQQFGR